MKLINLTPHEIKVFTETGDLLVLPSSGVSRVSKTQTKINSLCGVPVYRNDYDEVSGLPEPRDGVAYIVSGITAAASKGRADVFVPTGYIRDDTGLPMGCKGLQSVAEGVSEPVEKTKPKSAALGNLSKLTTAELLSVWKDARLTETMAISSLVERGIIKNQE